ncbi:MAG: S8 family peptidase, partial [Ignavibacteria bacterium]|nr:S8 family peptidase [Ignavibacteria bacterium]
MCIRDSTWGDTNVSVGIVDSGSDLDHPDLAANIKYNYADPINNIDDDNNGYIDDFAGWDFFYGDNDPNINGGSDHGSHVSGCASQVTNNGVHGGGPGFRIKLRITKHSPDTPGNLIYDGPSGIIYHYANQIKFINCSFGSGSYSSYFQTVCNNAWNAGSMVFGSAGNDGQNVPRYPASYDNVVSVAATNSNDFKASFSNYHSTVDVSAPGDAILSTLYNNTYATFSGTSMSTPITAGVAALIKSRYPSWTNSQILSRLLLGVDSIYHLNQQYIGMLGTGRVNALKCVTDLPIIALQSFQASDSLYGNNDGVFEVDEVVTIRVTYKNIWQSGNNISLRLQTSDPNVELVQDSLFVGNLNAYHTYSTTVSNTFRVKAKPNCPFDRSVTFKLGTSVNAIPNDPTNSFNVTFRQGWVTHTVNNLKLSLTRDAAVGKKPQPYGSGLQITGYTGNQIFEGGLMIGINQNQVSDVCRRAIIPSNQADTDFVSLTAYTLNKPGNVSHEDGRGRFNDDGAGSSKIGVTVNSYSYAWNNSQDQDYIIIRHVIRNTSGNNITNLHAGIFILFTPNGQTSQNISTVDSVNKIGYTYNTNNTNPYLGIALLSNHTLNFRAYNISEITDGFTSAEKWNGLSQRISVPSLGPGLNGFVVAAGPININNGDSVVVGFAVVKGNDLNQLIANSGNAKNRFQVIGIEQISAVIPARFSLYQNYPNPFNPNTTIKFDVPLSSDVEISLYDVTGRLVRSLLNQKLEAGTYRLNVELSELPSGVYFYNMRGMNFSETRKMVLIK